MLGTVISTFVVGMFVYAVANMGIVNIATDSPLQSLLFGALISAGMVEALTCSVKRNFWSLLLDA